MRQQARPYDERFLWFDRHDNDPAGGAAGVDGFRGSVCAEGGLSFDSANCGASPQSILLAPNQTATFMISTAHTTTLLLREKYCATWFLGCWQYDFRPRAIFDDAAFWSLFGGRQVTLDWFQ
jgi:hypothetical protein